MAKAIEDGTELLFPAEDMRIVAMCSRRDAKPKFYKIYDNLRDEFIRKINKENLADDATCINHTGTLLAYI